MTICEQYSSIPVLNRFGVGSYTYKLVIDTGVDVFKYELFANSAEGAMYLITTNIGVVVNMCFVGTDIMTVRLENYYNATCYLYI